MSDTLRVSNIHFGNVASNNNQPQMGFTSVGIGSTTNYGFLQFFGTPNTLCWTANGTVGIGTTAPLAKLQCNETPVNGDVTRREVFRGVREGTVTVQNAVSMAFALGANKTEIDPFGCLDIKVNGLPTLSNNFGAIPDVTVMSIIGNGMVGIGTNNPISPLHLFTPSTGLANGIMSVYSSSILSSTASSYDILQRWYESSSNASFVDLMWVRGSTGSNWETTSQRFQAKTDGTWQGFIEFNGSNNNYGVTIGTGSSTSNPNSVPGKMYVTNSGNVGIGVTNPQAMLHVQGGTLVTNPTVYNTAVAGWFIIGYWDCTAAQSVGAHLKLRIIGCNGYDNSTDTNQMGGETTIYLNNLNNLNTTTNANVDGLWKSEGGRTAITQVKAVQGSSRYQYFIYALVQSYTQHSITAETTQGTIWTSQMTSTSDPGANSLTVRVLTLSTAAVGTNVGIGVTAPAYTLDVNGSSGAVGLSVTRSMGVSGSGRISYYNGTGSVLYWLLGSISSLVSTFGGSIDINGDLVRIDTALKNVQFGCSVNYGNFTVNRSSASGSTGTTNGNIVVYRNTTTSFYDVYLVFASASSFVGDVIYSNASFMYLTPNFVEAPSTSATYFLVVDHSVNNYMAITNSGYVGIGVTNPGYPLQIGGSGNYTYAVSWYYGGGGQVNNQGGNVTSQVSLFLAQWGVTGAAWGVTSDRRIKTNIEPVSNILDIIQQVNVVKYDYIDPQYGREECSVIAQDLQAVFPNAINITTDYVPNIFKICSHVQHEDVVTLSVTLASTSDNIADIKVGSTLKMMISDDSKTERDVIVTILSVSFTEHTIQVSSWENYDEHSAVFVYGTEVKNFLSVDKPQLGVMALQGVKELQQIVIQQEERITKLEALIAKLTS